MGWVIKKELNHMKKYCDHEWENKTTDGILTASSIMICKKCNARKVIQIRSGDFVW